jgi:hypothetical protein
MFLSNILLNSSPIWNDSSEQTHPLYHSLLNQKVVVLFFVEFLQTLYETLENDSEMKIQMSSCLQNKQSQKRKLKV